MKDAETANSALERLTHYYVRRPLPEVWIDMARQRWQQWWLTARQDARTYRPGDCVPDTPLP